MLDGHGAAVERAVVDTPALHALERKAELAKLGLLLLVLLELKLEARLLFLYIERIIAAVELRLAVVDLHDAADDTVEKIPVVRDGQDGALEFLNVVLEPLHAVHIEMVRRLVEQQDVRPFQQQPRQIDARLFSAGEACKLLPALRGGDGKAVADLIRLRVGLIAAARREAVHQLVVAAQQLLRGVVGHLRLDGLHLHPDAVELRERRAQHVVHRIARRIDRDL